MGMTYIDKAADRVYQVYGRKNKSGVMEYRPYYSHIGHLRVVPGTHWWRYKLDAEDELRELARVNGWPKY